ncbi:hypothetical protein MOO45_03125 [Bombilactobacillus folatiphilus]|uniref:Uncharacterized protein n=1 Tax=Bombilactobacillus folatiphilus TaxID=2923362 RepID=A0ABY4PAF6_9LACO|nr:hypothetical protein [Bombilactobacillus folatiphilus]UQS82652.1 hypothetical protein MOO45_03125 [Bombilactobacillus folatiphilus]
MKKQYKHLAKIGKYTYPYSSEQKEKKDLENLTTLGKEITRLCFNMIIFLIITYPPILNKQGYGYRIISIILFTIAIIYFSMDAFDISM